MKKLGLLVVPLIVMPFLVNCNNSITITWVDDDGTVLEVDKNVKKGVIPTYDGPSLASWYDSECFYSFKGWSPEVAKATKSMTYTATYNVLDIEGADAYLKLVIPEENQDKTFSFRYESEGEISVDWGDESPIDHAREHTYESAGSYNVKIRNINNFSTAMECAGLNFLKEIYFGKGITSMHTSCLQECRSLSLVAISSSITSISGSSILFCSQLSTIVVDENNPNFDSRDNCNAIITKIDVDEFSINTMIAGCKNTIIPNTVTSLDSTFHGCTSLTSIVIPNSVTYINGAFDCCTSLTSIVIPDGLTYIGSGSFNDCSSLASINIPNGVTFIGSAAFSGCTALTSINIPNSVSTINPYAFAGCSSLSLVDLTTYTKDDNIPELADSHGYPFRDCSEELKFKVGSLEMANFFKDSSKNWPSELEKYDYPVS